MFLKRLVLENVKSIQHLEFRFTTPEGNARKWTFILGENGCGKSTVLRSIALLLAGSEALPDLLGNPDSWIRLGQDECSFHADIVTAEGEERTVDLKLKRGDSLRDIFTRNEVPLAQLDSALEHSARNYLTIGYGEFRRLRDASVAAPAPTLRSPRAQSVASLFHSEATLISLENWAMDLHYRRGQSGLETVRRVLSDLLPPGVSFEDIDKEERQVTVRTQNGVLPLARLGDNYQPMASWGGDLLYRITQLFSDRRNPFSARGLLLLEEIELHLHPSAERQVVHFLQEKLPNFQIVASTNSVITAHQAGMGELFVLRCEAPTDAPTLYEYPGEPRSLMLHQLLLSPVFGFTTVDSRPVELMRDEYKALEAKSTSEQTPKEKRRLKQLRESLQDLPEWGAELPIERKQRAVLEQIQQALQSGASQTSPFSGESGSGSIQSPGGSEGSSEA